MSEANSAMVGSRHGMNPSRTKHSTYRPARVTAAVLVHIPHQVGYYAERLPVLETCLDSLVGNAGMELDLLVFDNASCEPVREYLVQQQERGMIQFLLRSHTNLGKIGALQLMLGAAPGELVAYSDDDIYFHPDWLMQQLQVLETYPKVGMVGGYALPSFFTADRISAGLAFAADNKQVSHREGKLIPEDWIRQWAISTGRDPEATLREQADIQEHLFELDGVPAYGATNHDQFLAPKQVLEACLPESWSGNLMGDMFELDRAINEAGYLRLSTAALTTHHLGNRLAAGQSQGAEALGGRSAPTRRGAPGWWIRLLYWRPVRYVVLGLYSKLFRLVNPE